MKEKHLRGKKLIIGIHCISATERKSEIVPVGTVKFSPKARVKLSASRIVKLPPLIGGSDEEWQPEGLRKDNTLGGRRLAVDPCCQSSNFTLPARAEFHFYYPRVNF